MLRPRPTSTLFPYTTLFRSLFAKGIPFERSFDGLNATDADLVEGIHREYLAAGAGLIETRSEEHTSELQSRFDLVCRLLLEKKNTNTLLPFAISYILCPHLT